MKMSRGRRLFWTLMVAVGVPTGVVFWSLLYQLDDIGALHQQNPLTGVAATLLDRLDQRIRTGAEMMERIAGRMAASQTAPTEALPHYAEYVHSGPFLALSVALPDGRVSTYPSELPDALGAAWSRTFAPGMSDLIHLPGGAMAVTMSAPVAGDRPARVVGLFDVQSVLGRGELDRMRVASGGEAFVADESGRVILSANRHLIGYGLSDMGLSAPLEPENTVGGRFVDANGRTYLTALAANPGWYRGPHRRWLVGLLAPEQALHSRTAGMEYYLRWVLVAVVIITGGMIWVLRRSYRGRR